MRKSTYSGVLVTLEGTEGVGKSTLAKALQDSWSILKKKPKLLITREPGGSPLAEKIRNVLLHEQMDPWTEVFLYEACRSDHVQRVILPALNKGMIVVCDRFTDSTLAYQGSARGLNWKRLETLNCFATQGLTPDLTVWLDLPIQEGLKRVKEPNRFELEGLEFQKRVYRGFAKTYKQEPKRFLRLNIKSQTPEELALIVKNKLLKLIHLKQSRRQGSR